MCRGATPCELSQCLKEAPRETEIVPVYFWVIGNDVPPVVDSILFEINFPLWSDEQPIVIELKRSTTSTHLTGSPPDTYIKTEYICHHFQHTGSEIERPSKLLLTIEVYCRELDALLIKGIDDGVRIRDSEPEATTLVVGLHGLVERRGQFGVASASEEAIRLDAPGVIAQFLKHQYPDLARDSRILGASTIFYHAICDRPVEANPRGCLKGGLSKTGAICIGVSRSLA